MPRLRANQAALAFVGVALGTAVVAAAACNSVSGVEDYTFESGVASGSTSASSASSSSATATSSSTGTAGGDGGVVEPGTCPSGDATECTAVENATARCEAGACVAECAPGFADCDGEYLDGCEVAVATDPTNCGACGRACGDANVEARACVAGACAPVCKPAFADCAKPAAAEPDDGCETAMSDANCGACGAVCGGLEACGGPATCVCEGGLGTCGGGLTAACNSGACVCGLGAKPCALGETCQSGKCACGAGAACAAGQTCCAASGGEACADLKTDPKNCGSCGHACAPGFACADGACACDAAADCDAGGGGACDKGLCGCAAGAACAPNQRCLANGTCG